MHTLIGLHAGMGEMGALAFLWVFVELLNMSEASVRRARIAALWGTILFIGSWIAGGWNYLTYYASVVKPLIIAGPMPLAHNLIMETKEHVFLFLPVLALVEVCLLYKYKGQLVADKNLGKSATYIAFLIVLLALAMVGMGVIISGGFTAALEAKI